MHIAAMPRCRRHIAAVLCVLVLNLQLFAANVIGCVHAGGTQTVTAHCAHTGAPAPAAADAQSATPQSATSKTHLPSGAPCHKCSLSAVAAGWNLLAVHVPPGLAPAAREHPTADTIPQLHTRAPDVLLRPPRPFSG